MATVTKKLTITSSDLLSQTLNISVSKSVTASHTTGLARKAITSTAKGTASGQVTLATSGEFTSPNYIFIKNTDTTETDYVSVYADTSSDDPDLFYIPGGGFAIIPLTSGLTLKAYATTSGTIVEYMIFGTEA
jgi:acetyl esterase/lipase